MKGTGMLIVLPRVLIAEFGFSLDAQDRMSMFLCIKVSFFGCIQRNNNMLSHCVA